LAAAAAVVVAAGGTALLTAPGTSSEESKPPIAAQTPDSVPPAGMRWVGLGKLAIAVPQEWETNALQCATPVRDTVIINLGMVHLCKPPRPRGVESVELGTGAPGDRFRFHADEIIDIDGVRAERQRTTCTPGSSSEAALCTGVVLVPSQGVWFLVESSTNAETVDRVLQQITVVPDRVGVPAFLGSGKDQAKKYLDLLIAQGLRPEVNTVEVSDDMLEEVTKVSPAAGTMVKPGTEVTVTVHKRR
jgi:hypothetical protein